MVTLLPNVKPLLEQGIRIRLNLQSVQDLPPNLGHCLKEIVSMKISECLILVQSPTTFNGLLGRWVWVFGVEARLGFGN